MASEIREGMGPDPMGPDPNIESGLMAAFRPSGRPETVVLAEK